MFVAIDNSEMNVNEVLTWINKTRDASVDKKISPECAMEILSKTYFLGHIKAVLKNIKDRCKTKEDVLPYKEFILSCVDGREMSDIALGNLREMAKVCDCEEELDEINAKPKVYTNKDVKGIVIYDRRDLKVVSDENIPIFIDLSKGDNVRDRVYFREEDFSNVVGIKCKEGCELEFRRIVICKNLTIDGLCRADFKWCVWSDNSRRLDLTDCSSLQISYCENVSENIDASSCKVINFKDMDLGNWDKFKFGDDVDLTLTSCKNIPEKFDLSFASDVTAMGVDLSKVKELKFRDGANVDFCDYTFHGGIKDTVLPEYIDFSNCGKVNLQVSTAKMKQIRFRDRAQGGEWAETYESFGLVDNAIVYADEEKANNNIRPAHGGMEM